MLLRDTGIRHPLAVMFAGMALGICIYVQDWLSAGFCMIVLFLLYSNKRVVFMAAGIIVSVAAAFISVKPIDIEGLHEISGKVVSSGFEYGMYRIEIKGVSLDGTPIRGKARISVYENIGNIKGVYLKAPVIVYSASGPDNFDQADFRYSLQSEGISLRGYIKDFNEIEFSGKAPPGSRLAELLERSLNNDAGVLKAVLTGDRSGVTAYVNDIFASLGVSHLIAISGLHFGLVILFGYLVAFNIIRLIPVLAQRIDTPLVSKCFGLASAIYFGVIIESSFPAIRALIMACTVTSAFMYARRVNLFDALALSGIIILTLWPMSLFTPSFQLSFAAVFGIVIVIDRLKDKNIAVKLLAIPVIAAIFTMPVSIHWFGFISPVGIISNLIIVPFFSFIIMPLGLLGMVLCGIWQSGALYLFGICNDGISLILMAGERFGSLIAVPKPGLTYYYLFYLTVFIALFASRSMIKYVIVSSAAAALILIPPVIQHQRMSKGIAFDFISVGQGDCILITKGRNAVLIDAGGSRTGFDTGRFIVGPRLLSRGITRLDLVVATHSHPDHAGGLPYILDKFKTELLWINCRDDPGFTDILEVANMKKIPLKAVKAGDCLTFPNGLKLDVMHPQRHLDFDEKALDLNLHSIVLAGGDEDLRGLFMADSDMFGELNMVHLERDIKADVLKVAHHGSKRSCQDIFIDSVDPRAAVIMCGRSNPFSLPSGEAVSRLKSHGVEVLLMPDNGETLIFYNKDNIIINTFKNSAEKTIRRANNSLSQGAPGK